MDKEKTTYGFFEFMITTYINKNNPEGDFARDSLMLRKQFPHIGSADSKAKKKLVKVLENTGMCEGAWKAFENIWKEWEYENGGI